MMNEKKCCICGLSFTEYGNNPWPVNMDEEARCCDVCNAYFILPKRLEMIYRKEDNES